jgi:DNA-binding NarL/FixJ family response regulator
VGWALLRTLSPWSVDVVRDASEAEGAMAAHAFDCAIIDVCLSLQFPYGGLDVARALRRTRSSLPIILMSGLHSGSLAIEAQSVGADAWFHKGSTSPDEVRLLVRRVLDSHREREEDRIPDRRVQQLIDHVCNATTEEIIVEARKAHGLALLASAALAQGDETSELCAAAVGLSRQGLQRYAPLARLGPLELQRLLVELVDGRGQHFTVSHGIVLARLSRPLRDATIMDCVANGIPPADRLEHLARGLRSSGDRPSAA